MTRIGVMHVNNSSPRSTSPTMRTAKWVADHLPGCDFIYDVPTAARVSDVQFDVLFVKYGMLAFSEHRADALKIHAAARRVINLENDYTFSPDKRFRKPDETWSTVEGRTRYCNWNVLTRHGVEGWPTPLSFRTVRNKGLVYYGAHRPGRVVYFERYLKSAPYPVTVSSFRGQDTFGVTCGNRVRLLPAFRDPDIPSEWEMTVYLEDVASHALYCSPANRFYECLHMGLAQAIDANCVKTLARAGVPQLSKFVVSTKMGVRALLTDWREIRDEQQRLWRRDYSADLLEQFNKAVRESGV